MDETSVMIWEAEREAPPHHGSGIQPDACVRCPLLVPLGHLLAGDRLHILAGAAAAELHQQRRDRRHDAVLHAPDDPAHLGVGGIAGNDGVKNAAAVVAGVKVFGVGFQVAVKLSQGLAAAQFRLVGKQLQDVAGAGQADVGVHVDLADAALCHVRQLGDLDAEGVFQLAAQGVDGGHELLRHGGGTMADQESVNALVEHALLGGDGDLAADAGVLALVGTVARCRS